MSDPESSSPLRKRFDIFPEVFSVQVDPLSKNPNFQDMSCKSKIFPFLFYLNNMVLSQDIDVSKIYYDEVHYNVTLQKHFINVTNKMKESKPHKRFLQWIAIHRRILDANTKSFRNTDQRTCFLIEKNHFIVPQGFTFGVRTVLEGTGHLYITHNIPLQFYQLKSYYCKGRHAMPRIFNPSDQGSFYHRKLQAHSYYLVPEGTNYVITTLESTFFAVHIVPSVFSTDVTLKNPLDEPKVLPKDVRPRGMETPNVHDERFERYEPSDPVLLAFQSGQKVRISDLSSPAPSPLPTVTLEDCPPPLPVVTLEDCPPPLPVVTENCPPPPLPLDTENDPSPPLPMDTENYPPPPLPVVTENDPPPPLPVMTLQIVPFSLERVVQVVAPDVVSWYASLCRNKIYDDPKPTYHYGPSQQSEPMDLSISDSFSELESLITTETQNDERYQEVLGQLETIDERETVFLE